MNKQHLLTSIFAISFATSAMADTPVVVPAGQFPNLANREYMQPNTIYKGAAVADNMAGVFSGRVYANPEYEPIDGIECNPGYYLPANATECASCTAGSYCPGGSFGVADYNQGIAACVNGSYSANAGSSICTPCANGQTNIGEGNTSCEPAYTITYTAGQGGVGADQTQSGILYGTRFTTKSSSIFSKPNATFLNWESVEISSSWTEPSTEYTFDLRQNVTLRARWGCNAEYTLNSSGACVACPEGTHKPTVGNGSCTSVSCAPGQYLPAGSTSCATCPSDYPNSNGGNGDITQCYSNTKSRTWTGTSVDGTVPTGCSVTWNTCSVGACDYVAYSNASGNGDGTVKSGCLTNNANCTNTIKTLSANDGYYAAPGATSCTVCPAGASGSDNGRDSESDCFYTCPTKSVTNAVSVAIDNAKVYHNGTSYPSCTYTATCDTGYKASGNGTSNPSCDLNRVTCSAGQYLPKGAISCSTCLENNYCEGGTHTYSATEDQGLKPCESGTVSSAGSTSASACRIPVCGEGQYLPAGTTECKSCPTAYPNSNGGSGDITQCYSNAKSRAWTGNQVEGDVPNGCASVTEWGTCSREACSYVAYANASGNGDGTIKEGCSVNNASCTKPVKSVSANNGYYAASDATSCTACPEGASGSDNGRDSKSDCFYTCPTKTVTNAVSVAIDNAKVYHNGTSYPSCTYTATCDTGYKASGNGTSNPSCDLNRVTCSAGQYLPKGAISCSTCSENNYCEGGTYTYSATENKGVNSCPAGKVSPQGATSAGECGKIMRVGEDVLYLTSEKQTTPALAVKIDGNVYYAKTTAGAKPMNKTTSKSLRTKIDGVEYSIHDNTK